MTSAIRTQSEKSLAMFFFGLERGISSTQLYTSCISSSVILCMIACSSLVGAAIDNSNDLLPLDKTVPANEAMKVDNIMEFEK